MTRSSASAGLLAALALGACVARASEPTGPRAIAHRGVVQEAPENTWPAIAKAIELGCALAEIDLRYTADGEIVLIHDATVDRTTDGTGLVSGKTLAEIQDARRRRLEGRRVPRDARAAFSRGGGAVARPHRSLPRPEGGRPGSGRAARRAVEGARDGLLSPVLVPRAAADPGRGAGLARARRPRGLGAGAGPRGDAPARHPDGRALRRLGALVEGRGRGSETPRGADVRQRPRGERHAREPARGGASRLRLHPDRQPARARRDPARGPRRSAEA